MAEKRRLALIKADLQRAGNLPGDGEEYLSHLLKAAQGRLERQGIKDDGTDDYEQVLISTATWLYRKRVNGEAEPDFLRRMRLDIIVSQRTGGVWA